MLTVLCGTLNYTEVFKQIPLLVTQTIPVFPG